MKFSGQFFRLTTHIEYLIQTHNTLVLILYSKLMTNVANNTKVGGGIRWGGKEMRKRTGNCVKGANPLDSIKWISHIQ